MNAEHARALLARDARRGIRSRGLRSVVGTIRAMAYAQELAGRIRKRTKPRSLAASYSSYRRSLEIVAGRSWPNRTSCHHRYH